MSQGSSEEFPPERDLEDGGYRRRVLRAMTSSLRQVG